MPDELTAAQKWEQACKTFSIALQSPTATETEVAWAGMVMQMRLVDMDVSNGPNLVTAIKRLHRIIPPPTPAV